MTEPTLTVIVCTYNRADLLTKCLDSIAAQTLDSDLFELIVVDNNSTDKTPQVADEYEPKIRHFRYVFENNQGLSHARNRGIEEAHSEYLVYLDDDALAPPEFLANLVNVIKSFRPDFVGGPVYPYYIDHKPAWFRDSYEIKKYENESRFSQTCRVTGANYTVKADVFQRVGTFNVKMGMIGNRMGLGEDAALLDKYRLITPPSAQKVYYSMDCWVTHYVPKEKMKLGYYLKRKYLSGRTQVRIAGLDNASYLDILLTAPKGLLSASLQLASQLKRNGPIRADYILVIGTLARMLGKTVEASSHAWGRRRNRRAHL